MIENRARIITSQPDEQYITGGLCCCPMDPSCLGCTMKELISSPLHDTASSRPVRLHSRTDEQSLQLLLTAYLINKVYHIIEEVQKGFLNKIFLKIIQNIPFYKESSKDLEVAYLAAANDGVAPLASIFTVDCFKYLP